MNLSGDGEPQTDAAVSTRDSTAMHRRALTDTTWQKRYRWTRTWGDEAGLNGRPHEDHVAYDGEVLIGRIYLDQQTLKAGRWRWAIQYPQGGQSYLPNSGWEETAAEAAKVVEDCWYRQIRLLTGPD